MPFQPAPSVNLADLAHQAWETTGLGPELIEMFERARVSVRLAL